FQKLEKDPVIAKFFLTLMAKKCVTLNKRIETLGLTTVRKRLIQYLIANCSGQNKCSVELKMKKVELAKLLGTISETLSRNLKQMQDEELIEVKGKKILVKSCPKLRAELFY
ncbi:Crp/Fnr family transcriptional regulator, partial [Acidobacteriota bacterium]